MLTAPSLPVQEPWTFRRFSYYYFLLRSLQIKYELLNQRYKFGLDLFVVMVLNLEPTVQRK